MKIIFICDEYPPLPHGGLGTFVRTIAHGMVKAGHEITVVGYAKKGIMYKDQGVQVVILKALRIPRIAWLLNRYLLYRWIVQKTAVSNSEIIEVPEYSGDLPFHLKVCPVAVRLHISAVSAFLQAGESAKSTLQWCEKNTLAKHRNWIAVSQFALQLTQKTFNLKPDYSEVIYYPVPEVEIENKPVAPLPDKYILFAGSVSERKGALILAEACKKIFHHYKDLHLVYAGVLTNRHGKSTDYWIRSIMGPELMERVHILGRLTHAEVLYCMRNAKMLVFPSKLETFGLVVIEAMACGIPVIYSTLPPGPEVIEHGINGLLADPHSADDVADKILSILNDPLLTKQLIQNASITLSERFSLEKCMDHTLQFYHACIRNYNSNNI